MSRQPPGFVCRQGGSRCILLEIITWAIPPCLWFGITLLAFCRSALALMIRWPSISFSASLTVPTPSPELFTVPIPTGLMKTALPVAHSAWLRKTYSGNAATPNVGPLLPPPVEVPTRSQTHGTMGKSRKTHGAIARSRSVVPLPVKRNL